MKNDITEVIKKTSESIAAIHNDFELFDSDIHFPNSKNVIDIIYTVQLLMFSKYFRQDNPADAQCYDFVGKMLHTIYSELKNQIIFSLAHSDCNNIEEQSEVICIEFIKQLPIIQQKLLKDAEAGFKGDPAAKSVDEIILSYPGFFTIFVYRIANVLYKKNVSFIPRIMTEYAHKITGIDINPGAKIGESFFIDHGTGIVIGETAVIGNNVKLYQGVTLGALSTKDGQKLSGIKRHPTIEDNVVIYAGTTILGGKTVIGHHSVIGGNIFITKSVAEHTKVGMKKQELILKKISKDD